VRKYESGLAVLMASHFAIFAKGLSLVMISVDEAVLYTLTVLCNPSLLAINISRQHKNRNNA
jgi:hypothetical protein